MADNYSGAINGTDDPTQSVYRKRRIGALSFSDSSALPGSLAPAPMKADTSPDPTNTAPAASNGIFIRSGQPTGPSGEYLPRTADTDRAARTGGGKFDPGSTVQNRDFDPVASALDRSQANGAAAFSPTIASNIPSVSQGGATGSPGVLGRALPLITSAAVPPQNTPAAPPGATGNPASASPLARPVGDPSSPDFVGPANDYAARAGVLARTPTFQQGADQVARNQAVLSRDVGFNQDPVYQAQQQARSDTNSILNKDPRSTLGIAARNAELAAGDSRSGRANYQRTVEQAVGGIQQNVANAQQSSLEGQRSSAQLENTGKQGENALATENVRANAELNKPQYEAGSDGNLVRLSGTGAQPVTLPGGLPLNVPGKINAPVERAHADIYKSALARYEGDPEAQAKAQADADAYKPPVAPGRAQPAKSAAGGPPKDAKAGDSYQVGNKIAKFDGKNWTYSQATQ